MKQLIAKAFLLIGLAVGTQYLLYEVQTAYGQETTEDAAKERVELFHQYLNEDVDVIYFGDSVLNSVHPNDVNKQSIAEMVDSQLANYDIRKLSHGAYRTPMYLWFAQHMLRQSKRPELLVVPINLRSFSAGWDKRPDFQFERLYFYLQYGTDSAAYYKFLSVYGQSPRQVLTYDQYLQTPVDKGGVVVGTVGDFHNDSYDSPPPELLTEKVKSKILFHYLYRLTPDHPHVRDLQTLAQISVDYQIPILFYVTPVDYQIGHSYYPQEFISTVNANIQIIENAVRSAENQANRQKSTITWSNLVYSIGSNQFDHYHSYPIEHLKESGRQSVANRLSPTIQSILRANDESRTGRFPVVYRN